MARRNKVKILSFIMIFWFISLRNLPVLPGYVLLFLAVLAAPVMSQTTTIPHLVKQGTVTRLMVHDEPFLMLAGELGNSSASDPVYMRSKWPVLKSMNLNTVLVPVYWEFLEPAEGMFDYTLVDSAIGSARKYDMKIVFLWFGSWKNSMSCYVPLWVKENPERFPRARKKDGTPLEILSPFSATNRLADEKAFAALMKHIQLTDGKEQYRHYDSG